MTVIHKIIILVVIGCLFPSASFAMSITLGIPDKYTEVKAGDPLYFITEVKYPENDARKDLRIEYYLMNKDNVEVGYMKVLKAIETQASFMDSMTIPVGTESGMYRVVAKIADYQELKEEVGASFNVVKSPNESNKLYLLIILILVAIIAVGFIIQLVVFLNRRPIVLVKKNARFA